jgi:hypothetical protein
MKDRCKNEHPGSARDNSRNSSGGYGSNTNRYGVFNNTGQQSGYGKYFFLPKTYRSTQTTVTLWSLKHPILTNFPQAQSITAGPDSTFKGT